MERLTTSASVRTPSTRLARLNARGSTKNDFRTNVAARGIDVADVGRVIHLDLPSDSEVLTHRSGRTGALFFIWVWLAASLLNGAVGVVRAGIPMLNEIGAFIPIFGIPAALACYLAYRQGSSGA